MSGDTSTSEHTDHGLAPGDPEGPSPDRRAVLGYVAGLVLAAALTAVSFGLVQTTLVWQPSIPVALSVLAVAQMGVHLVFFLHVNTGPDGLNNLLALAFGLLIVLLLVLGSLWIMGHLRVTTMPTHEVLQHQR